LKTLGLALKTQADVQITHRFTTTHATHIHQTVGKEFLKTGRMYHCKLGCGKINYSSVDRYASSDHVRK
jgi:hypothetical protein